MLQVTQLRTSRSPQNGTRSRGLGTSPTQPLRDDAGKVRRSAVRDKVVRRWTPADDDFRQG